MVHRKEVGKAEKRISRATQEGASAALSNHCHKMLND